MTSGDASSPVSFSLDPNVGRLVVTDDVTGVFLTIDVADPSALTTAPTDSFVFPVNDAIAFTTDELVIPPEANANLRDVTGEYRGQFSTEPRELSEQTHYIELEFGQVVKTYIRLPRTSAVGAYDAPREEKGSLHVSLPDPVQVEVGARSFHERPRATITVPDDPRALMRAVATLGSSLKELTPERSWVTLRGYPPAIEIGDELSIPDALTPPDTGVTITVPESVSDVYRVAPLAYYLGATVQPGDPAIHLDTGHTEHLDRPLEPSVDRLLATCLTLDTLTRIGGYYSLPRYEYDEIAPELPFYPPNLYDASISEQLMEYFEVPWETIEPVVPRWPTTAVFRDDIADAPLLPHVLNGLWRVHVGDASASRLPSVVRTRSADSPRPGEGRLTQEAFETALHVDRATLSTATAAVRSDPAARADRLRSVLENHGVDAARTDTRSSGSDIDLLYADRSVARLTEEPRPTVAVLAGGAAVETGLELVRTGSVSVLAFADGLSTEDAAGVLDLLATGHPPASVLDYVRVDTDGVVLGHPSYTSVRNENGRVPLVVRVTSNGMDTHRLAVRLDPSDERRLGGAIYPNDAFAEDIYQLTGVNAEQSRTYSTRELLDVLNEDESFVLLNGRSVYPSETVTAAMVRESVQNIYSNPS